MARPLRSTFILTLAGIATLFAAVGGWRYARASAPVNGPVVLIAVNGLRADRLSAYHGPVQTPAINALAADGLLFEHAYTQSPLLVPAYASLLTGRLPIEHRVRDNETVLPRRNRLVAESFHDRGYTTLGVVSSYLAGRARGLERGFDSFDDQMPITAEDADVSRIERAPAGVTAKVEEWLDTQRSGRFFLFVQLTLGSVSVAVNDTQLAYDTEVAGADETVGKLVRALKSHQLYDQATLILTAPFAEGLGDHGERLHGVFVYDDTVRVPLIIKAAGGSRAGTRIDAPVQTIDITATMLDLIRSPQTGDGGGRSLKPILDGSDELPATPIVVDAFGLTHRLGWAPLEAVGEGTLWFVRAPEPELYNRADDPAERHNIIDDQPEQAMHLAEVLRRLDPPHTEAADPSPAVADRLEALGFEPLADRAVPPPSPMTNVESLTTYEDAVLAESDGHVREAITRTRELLRHDPTMIAAWQQLGYLLAQSGRAADAVEAFDRAARLQPLDAHAHLALAYALARVSNVALARAHADLASTLANADDRSTAARAHALLARLAVEDDDEQAARLEAGRAETADPSLPMRQIVDGWLAWRSGDYPTAVASLDAAGRTLARCTLQPRDVRYALAESLLALDRADEAEPWLQAETALFPDHVAAQTALVMLYHREGRDQEAADQAAALSRAVPTSEGYTEAARLLRVVGHRREAAELIRRVHGATTAQ